MKVHSLLACAALSVSLPAAARQVEFCSLPDGYGTAAVTLEISGGDDGAACLTFRHERAPDSSLVGVYIECDLDSPFLEDTVVINGEGVEFQAGGNPDELPGGGALHPPFVTNVYFTAAPPAPKNGVQPGELVALCFCMPDGMDSDDLERALADGSMRIGLRILVGTRSGSFISRRCNADFNCDWALDVNDFAAFQRAWLGGDHDADFDQDGDLDVRDFIAFRAAFDTCGS